MRVKRCGSCKRKFPDHLIQPMVTSEGTFVQCPLCALEHRNLLHGMPMDTPFHGEMAAAMWEEAKAFIEKKAHA